MYVFNEQKNTSFLSLINFLNQKREKKKEEANL